MITLQEKVEEVVSQVAEEKRKQGCIISEEDVRVYIRKLHHGVEKMNLSDGSPVFFDEREDSDGYEFLEEFKPAVEEYFETIGRRG